MIAQSSQLGHAFLRRLRNITMSCGIQGLGGYCFNNTLTYFRTPCFILWLVLILSTPILSTYNEIYSIMNLDSWRFAYLRSAFTFHNYKKNLNTNKGIIFQKSDCKHIPLITNHIFNSLHLIAQVSISMVYKTCTGNKQNKLSQISICIWSGVMTNEENEDEDIIDFDE